MNSILRMVLTRVTRVGPRPDSRLVLYGFIYTCFLLGHVIILKNVDGVWIYFDSGEYYKLASTPLADSRFWGAARPPAVLLFYKLFGGYDYEADGYYYKAWDWDRNGFYVDDTGLLLSQTTFSLAAFSFLALACAGTARTEMGRLFLFVFPLLFSFVPDVARWNFIALSESLSISLFVVFTGAWILFLSTRRSPWLAGVATSALFWGGARDTNAYVLVMIAGIVTISMIVSTRFSARIPLTALCIWFIGIFTLSSFSAEAGGRWIFPFYNVMGQRILPVPEHVSWFSNHGMPIDPELLKQAGKWASDDGWAFFNEPRLEKFRAWTLDHGKGAYVKFLISHFTYSATAPFLGFSGKRVGLLLIGNGLTICLAFVSWRRRWLHRLPPLAVPLIMVLSSVPHAWLAWHGDAMETVRHSLIAFLQVPLGFGLLLLYVLDRIIHERVRDGRSRSVIGPAERGARFGL